MARARRDDDRSTGREHRESQVLLLDLLSVLTLKNFKVPKVPNRVVIVVIQRS